MTIRIAALLALLSLAGPAQAEILRRCAITVVDGPRVEIRRAGVALPGVPGLEVFNGDLVVTGPGTRVTLACGDGMRVAVAGGTSIDLGTLTGAAAAESYGARLLRGLAGFVLPLVGTRRFEVRTPTAVAAVRSTEWLVEVEGDGATAVFVREGAVVVRALQGGAPQGGGLLEAGEGIDVTAAGVAGPVTDWGAGRIEAVSARLGTGWE